MHGNLLHTTLQMGVIRLKVLILFNHTDLVAHTDSFRINISIAAMHRLTPRILYLSHAFQNTNVPIYVRVCVIPQPYYLDWFEMSHRNVPLNRDDGPFFIQSMNVIQGEKTAVIQ